jgi:hypothetical protein
MSCSQSVKSWKIAGSLDVDRGAEEADIVAEALPGARQLLGAVAAQGREARREPFGGRDARTAPGNRPHMRWDVLDEDVAAHR